MRLAEPATVSKFERYVNIIMATSTTKLTLFHSIRFAPSSLGAVVNIASASGTQNMPLLAQYSAAKGYVCMFIRGLSVECACKNVTVQTQVPFYVATKLAKVSEVANEVANERAE